MFIDGFGIRVFELFPGTDTLQKMSQTCTVTYNLIHLESHNNDKMNLK